MFRIELTEIESEVAHAAAVRARNTPKTTLRKRGIVHTPPELARFVARFVDALLRERWQLPSGLAGNGFSMLDPACGPGAFLAASLAVAREGAQRGSGTSRLPGGSPLVAGFDTDGNALRTARRILSKSANEAGWDLTFRRVDTLSIAKPFARCRSDDVHIVMGNPPWSARSASRTVEPTATLLEDFRRDRSGIRLGERKLGVLSDEYVRFWRWSAEAARSAPNTLVALVTNGSFLDGPVHRGMRDALMRWFDGIDVIDLGGSALIARAMTRDENVFGVRPAVAVTFAWRSSQCRGSNPRLRHVVLRGTAEEKLGALAELTPSSSRWESIRPVAPFFVFGPKRRKRVATTAWQTWPSLSEAMPFHREGVQTNRDGVVTDTDAERLIERLRSFLEGAVRSDLAQALVASSHYDVERARQSLEEHSLERSIRPLAYRPFEDRWFIPVAPLCHRPRRELLEAIDRSTFVLLSVRKDRGERAWAHFGATRHAPDNCWLSTRSSCRTRAFPTHRPDGQPNLTASIADTWSERFGVALVVDDFAKYALCVLASATFRATFADQLHLDYPRIPVPPDLGTFHAARSVGGRLLEALTEVEASPRTGQPFVLGHVRLQDAPEPFVQAVERADEMVRDTLVVGPKSAARVA